METRNSQKRKECQDKQESQDFQPPAKRTRSQSRQTKAPAPPAPPRSARSQRIARPQSTRTKPAAVPGASTEQAASTPLAQDSPKPSWTPDATASAPDPLDRPAPSSMDAPGRRGSRGEAASSGGEDDRDAGDMFGRNLGAAGSALQGLLRKLGANFEDITGMSGMRVKNILNGMKQTDDESAQLSSLTELCELLSISTEESLTTFPVEQVVPLLVQLLGMEHNPDIMLLAARALTFMADVLPTSCSAIVRHGAVPAFCARLLTIEYIDLAEQSLQALEKLSHEHPHALLQNGGLMAVLSYLDFFPTGVQRTAVATAATMCTGLGPSHVSAVKDALPILCNLLQYQDAKVVDNACLALLHIAQAYSNDASLLVQLQTAGLINQALQLISVNGSSTTSSGPQTSVATYFGMIKLLSTCASGSAAIAQQLLKAGVVDTLRQLLANCAMLGSSGSASSGSAPVLRTPDQLYEVMTLVHELLPAVPDAADAIMRGVRTDSPAAPAAGSAAAQDQDDKPGDSLTEFLQSDPEMVMTICSSLLPLSLQVYSSTVIPNVRSRCLATIVKLLAVASPSQLQTVLAELPISSFIAGLLIGRDTKAQAVAIQMAEILMTKLPDVFTTYFVKEGVAHAFERLADAHAASRARASDSGTAAAPAGVAAVTGLSSAAGAAARRSSSGSGPSSRSELPPPSPPVTRLRSRRTSKTDTEQKEQPSAAAVTGAPAPPAAGRPASLDSMRTPSLTLRAEIARRAAAFKEQYFSGSGPGGAAAQMESEGLRSLKQLCEQLKQDGPCLAKLLEALTSNDVSVFEMITSGAVDCLTQYLQGNDLAADDQTDAQLLCRLRQFTAAALTAHVQVGATTQNAQAAACGAAASASVATTIVPLTSLVRKLQMALASSEAFPVLCSRLAPAAEIGGGSAARSLSRSAGMSGSFSGGSLTSGLAALTQPFKLRLVRHPEDTVLKEYPASIVLIEPLANMSAIEDFLWPRVNRGSTVNALRARAVEGSATRRDAPAGAAAATAAAVADNKGSAGGTDAGNAGTSTTRRRSSSGTGNSKDGSAARPPAASKAQPIPDADGGSGRLTRAQAARARAQAQARAEEAAQLRQARRGAAGGSSDPLSDEHDVMEDDDDGLMMRDHMSSDQDDEHMHDGDEDDDDHDMMDAGGEDIFNPDEDEDEDEEMDDADLGVGSMPVHDLHLTEGLSAAAMTAAAAAADTTAGSSRGAVDTTSNRSAPADALTAAALDTRSSWRRSSQPLASPAAAAAASTGASAGGAARTAAAVAASALPRIVFYMNNHPLASTTTVFQAIQQGALNANGDADDDGADDEPAGLGGSGRRGRQLWDQIYTLYYKLGGTQQDDAVGVAAGSSSLQASSAGANSRQGSAALPEADAAATAYVADRGRPSHWRKSPLGELLAIKLPSNLAAPESCLDILKLVQLLEVINRLAPRLLASEELQLLQEGAADAAHQQQGAAAMAVDTAGCSQANGVAASEEVEAIALAVGEAAAGQMALAHVSRDEFISSKLSNKLAQQLKDVLAICGGGIPAWCHQLVVSCKFLFPFEIRRRYFYSTAFGLGRALHHMHQQQAAEGVGGALERDGRDLRIGRLQRQKVRVSRKRILESAVKVMELYAKHRAVLELEYFNEMGTGLGPTLEFYTMLSHELQKKALGMWRHEDPPEQQQQDSVDDVMQQDPLDEVTGGPSTAAAQQKQQEQQKEQAPRSNDAGGPDDKPSSAPASRPSSRGGTASEGVPPPSVQLHHEVMSHEQTTASAADYVYAPYGLFPAPLQQQQRAAGSSVVEYFRLLGRSVAKALQDNRLLDLPLNPVFFKAALGKPLDIYDLAQVDPVLGSSLERLAKAATAYAAAGSKGPLLVDGCPVNDLYLSFTLPGNASYELCPGGSDVLVDSSNLVQYIQGVVDATLGAGITAQMQAFREGFNEVFTLSALEVFYEDEMEVLLCGAGEHWSPQQLADSIKFDHGYTAQSTPVRHLLEILSELDPSDQRRFLRFVTGCPRLPPGGIAALQPRLTVVRKHPSLLPPSDGPTPGTTPGHSSMDWSNGTPLADGDLPSVMTCANYIKLPPYSCKDVMRERIMFAIQEGQGSFDLS